MPKITSYQALSSKEISDAPVGETICDVLLSIMWMLTMLAHHACTTCHVVIKQGFNSLKTH